MGLFGLLLSPLTLPIKGGVAVLEKVQEAAESEYFNEAKIKAALTMLSDAFDAGQLDEASFEREEQLLLDRFQEARRRRSP